MLALLTSSRRRIVVTSVVAAGVVLAATAAVAVAWIPGSDGVIHGCVAKHTGLLRVINDSQSCRPSEEPLSWDQSGGIRGYVRVSSDLITIPTGGDVGVDAVCPAGTLPMGGGFYIAGEDDLVSIRQSVPALERNSWFVEAHNDSSFNTGVAQAWAICAAVASEGAPGSG
jgi:hypothetical protein